ncbi:Sua5/YciO/YrdC/YwlC family protein [Candidatus Saccharibacteria bacterium]|nr:Sua5/YciO/YrdC/YwlC family protein [Candidatus Saccharibacteria bacterium]
MRKDIEDNFDKIVTELTAGNLVVMKSDTIYGIFALALDQTAVKKLHTIRRHNQKEGFLVLADSVESVARLVEIQPEVLARLKNIWPSRPDPDLGATSVIFQAVGANENLLTDTRWDPPEICFRVPNDNALRDLLHKTGPLCAPSANLPGQPPAQNITEARKYFGDAVDLYIDGGNAATATPSRMVKFRTDGTVETVRSDGRPHPEDFVITRRRKQFRFANFDAYENCFRLDEWAEKYQELLSSDKEIVLEIGAGSGEFLVELAKRNPDKIYLAIDRKSDRLYRGARRAMEEGITNIFFIFTTADKLKNVVPVGSASEVWLTFPDPFAREIYQSKRAELSKFYHDLLRFPDDKDYAKNLKIYEKDLRDFDTESTKNFDKYLSSDGGKRLTSSRFLDQYKEVLKPDGELFFKTDNAPLFDWSLEQFARDGWKNKFVTRDLHNSDAPDEAKVMTSYEERFTREKLSIKYAEFTNAKKGHHGKK